ncbi:PaaX family transcriptional regulator [Haloechinothrix sp. YIM 98757]|uniref:PaaX family transcriptional regulator n=1 Tax=Haloechinothrix aidingensis TaxID=2752311 RepID=A0A838A7I6_9PSEU|nr:PaaX family transcriptional regulator C-terminal domain-containing protein [Haloechinothrix aidingensis]MBA0124249.1 PaaX family transcriptional regulator [Haloechinothrix aidingensis]
MRPRSIVFDLFGDYIRYRGGAARLRSISALLDCFGVGDSTVRVVMARLCKEGWFDAHKSGRETVYALNSDSLRMLNEGRDRIFNPVREPWDGQWHMVIYSVPEAERSIRDQVRKELAWLGFGALASSTYISPHDRLRQISEHFANEPSVRLDLLTCQSGGVDTDREMAARCWDLESLNADYTEFLTTYEPRLGQYRRGSLTPMEALVERTQLIYDYRKFPFRDPDLPLELLPQRWVGRRAHDVFIEAHDLLQEPAEGYVDTIINQ